MYFKPRIFISSTLDLSSVRKKISEIFTSTGAEPILYEKNLTPSINRNTYMRDIQEADFVIFIFDRKYGTPTQTGKSGTHEEWDMVNSINIPSHIYINKDSKKDEELILFIQNKLKAGGYSFYYYQTEQELLKRLKLSLFTIAKECALSKINIKNISPMQIKSLAVEWDYREAMDLIRGFEEILDWEKAEELTIERTYIIRYYFEHWEHRFNICKAYFIDNRTDIYFRDLMKCVDEYDCYLTSQSDIIQDNNGLLRKLTIKLSSMSKELTFYAISHFPSFNRNEYAKLTNALFQSFQKFKSYVFDRYNLFQTIL